MDDCNSFCCSLMRHDHIYPKQGTIKAKTSGGKYQTLNPEKLDPTLGSKPDTMPLHDNPARTLLLRSPMRLAEETTLQLDGHCEPPRAYKARVAGLGFRIEVEGLGFGWGLVIR